MRPEQNTIEVDDTTQGLRVALSVDEENMGHIMDMLTGVYEDPEMAPPRELACNARDSHIAAGQTRPIEVTVGRQGSQLSLPVLKIQDWGVGLDVDDVVNLISKYGASTKRDGNTEVGMFGIGMKSPLAYTDQFTLICVKDGHKNVLSISREEEGGGDITVIDAGATDEPNGVTAEVPVHTGNRMLEKSEHFFSFWERGTVLLNGVEPEPVWEREGAFQITDSITVLPTNELEGDHARTDYVVMGNVPYPCDLDLYSKSNYRSRASHTVIAKVGIGGVSIPPARESLKDTKRTKDTVAKIKAEFRAACKVVTQAAVNKAANHGDALQEYVKAVESLPETSRPNPASITYKGDALPEWDEVFGSRALSSAGHKYSTGQHKPELKSAAQGIWITDYPNDNFTGGQREKLKLFLDSKGWTEPNRKPLFILRLGKPLQHAKWIPKAHVFKWDEIKKWRIPGGTTQSAYGTKVITGSYYCHQPPDPNAVYSRYSQCVEIAADSLPKSNLYWKHAGKNEGRDWYDLIAKYDSAATLVLLSANRIEKFQRDFPKAVEVRAAIRKKVEEKLGALADDTKFALALNSPDAEELAVLYPVRDKLVDPVLKRAVELGQLRETLDGEIREIEEEQRKWSVDVEEEPDPAIDAAFDRYPLIRHFVDSYGYGAHRKDLPLHEVLIYINAAYAARKEAS